MVKASGGLPAGYSQIGDDVAVIPVAGRKLVLKTDLLNRKTDVPRGMTYRQAARKSIAMCVSDFAAKGVKPDSFMVSVGLRKGTSGDKVSELARGFRDGAREWGLHLVGGDTSEADDLVIDCAMVGFADDIVSRSGARLGEMVVTTGLFGNPPAGLQILLKGARATGPFRKKALQSVLRPTPNLNVGLALSRFLSSSIDSSDGLAICLHTLAEMSRVGISLEVLPAVRGLRKYAKNNDLSTERLVFGGGEEYLIVGTIKKARFDRARKAARAAGGDLICIGTATNKRGNVSMRQRGKVVPVERIGWTHLSRR